MIHDVSIAVFTELRECLAHRQDVWGQRWRQSLHAQEPPPSWPALTDRALQPHLSSFQQAIAAWLHDPQDAQANAALRQCTHWLREQGITATCLREALLLLSDALIHEAQNCLTGKGISLCERWPLLHALERELSRHWLELTEWVHHQAAQQAEHQGGWWRALLEQIEEAVLVVEGEPSTVQWASPAAAALFGIAAQELEGRPLATLLAHDPASLEPAFPPSFETRILAGEQQRSVSVRLCALRCGTGTAWQLNLRDISEGRARERPGWESKHLLNAILQACGDALLAIDPEGRVQFWNARAEQLLGCPGSCLGGSSIADLLAESVPPPRAWPIPHPGQAPLSWVGREIELPQGGRRILEFLASPLRVAEEGRLDGWVLVCHDLTAHAEMKRRQEEANQQLKLLNDMARSIAARHDMQALFETVAEELRPLIAYDRMSVALVQEDGETLLVFALAAGESAPGRPRRAFLRQTSLGRVVTEGRPFIASTPEEIAQYPGDREIVHDGICSHIVLPLMGEGKVVGTFNLCCRQPHAYSQDHLELLEKVARHLALALHNTRLLEQERKRSQQLRLVAEVAESLTRSATADLHALLDCVGRAIHEHFGFSEVSLYLYHPEAEQLELRALQGTNPDPARLGSRHSIHRGLPGRVVRERQAIRVPAANPPLGDVSPLGYPQSPGAQMAVPIWQQDHLVGVIAVCSSELMAFDESDQMSMELIGRLLGSTLEVCQLHQETVSLHRLSNGIIATIPSSLALVDQDLTLLHVNHHFCSLLGAGQHELVGRSLEAVLPGARVHGRSLVEICEQMLAEGGTQSFQEVQLGIRCDPQRIVDLSCACVEQDGRRQVLLILDDVTDRIQRVYQLQLVLQLSQAIQETLDLEDLDRLLHAILTCVTAGPGLGFNRASLYLVEGETLVERMRVGPDHPEEVERLWGRLAGKQSLQEFLADYDRLPKEHRTVKEPRRLRLQDLRASPLQAAAIGREPYVMTAGEAPAYPFCEVLCPTREGIIAPLAARGELKGLIVADNFITRRPITRDDVELLHMLANQAALAISHAEAHRQLVLKEKLAAVGDMTTRIAHEIRGPLVTIGGMARRMAKKLEGRTLEGLGSRDRRQFEEYLPIISNEIQRLERILRNVLDYSHPRPADLQPVNLNHLVQDALHLHELTLSRHRIDLQQHLEPHLPRCQADPDQIKQVLFNLMRNAIDALCEETEPEPFLIIETWCDKEWVGVRLRNGGRTIDPHDLPYVFHPFFTLRRDGTGLGLAIARKIVEDHGGHIEVQSQAGQGTTVEFRLPRHPISGVGEEG